MNNQSMSEIFKQNFYTYDFIIFVAFGITLVFFIVSLVYSLHLGTFFSEPSEKRIENGLKQEKLRERKHASELQYRKMFAWQNCFYGIFVTLVSIFPLLGMIGTVWALLNCMVGGEQSSMNEQNFFGALTSTFWGAIFGISFKILDVFPNFFVERNNESYHIGIQRENLDIEENGENNEA